MSDNRVKITIQENTPGATNDYGEAGAGTWSLFVQTGAKINRLAARETLSGSKEARTSLYNFDILRTPKNYTINTEHRIQVPDGTVYDIISVDYMSMRDDKIIRLVGEEVK
jgi:hypothetical protein